MKSCELNDVQIQIDWKFFPSAVWMDLDLFSSVFWRYVSFRWRTDYRECPFLLRPELRLTCKCLLRQPSYLLKSQFLLLPHQPYSHARTHTHAWHTRSAANTPKNTDIPFKCTVVNGCVLLCCTYRGTGHQCVGVPMRASVRLCVCVIRCSISMICLPELRGSEMMCTMYICYYIQPRSWQNERMNENEEQNEMRKNSIPSHSLLYIQSR